MTPEQFLLVADLYPEPSLLLTKDGVIVAANRGTASSSRGRRAGSV